MPFLIITTWATLDLFQRYARIALVVKRESVGRALSTGFRWPIRYGGASYLYIVWFTIVLVITVVTQVLNAKLHVGVPLVLLGFLIQQISLFTRSAAKVGWIGSEVRLFERTYESELPLIAGEAESSTDFLGGPAVA